MSFAAVRSGEPIPIFNGKDYPYWKDKMKRNIMAINSASWEVVKNGITVKDTDAITPEEAKKIELDAEVWVFITNHLIPEKYHEVKNIPSAKGVWDYLEKIGEGVSTQKDARIDTLRSKFYRFKRHEGEKVCSIYSRLTALSNELISLGAEDITNRIIVRTLLCSLDDSFDHIVMMIKERTDFKDLVAADMLERLNTFEMEEDEKRDVNGTRRKSHALKARASHHSTPEASYESGCASDDPENIGKDLALIMRRFNRFQRRTSSSPKKNYSSRHSSDSSQHRSSSKNSSAKDNCCYKCKKPGHFIADCPLWEIEHKSKHSHSSSSSKSYRSSKNHDSKRYDSRSRKDKKDGSDDDKKKKYHKHREGSSSKSHSSRRKNSHRAKAYLGKEMNSEEEASGSEAGSKSRSGSGSGSESDGVAWIAFASNKNSSSFFSNQSSEDESPAYYFMAKAKVSSSKKSYDTSDGSTYESDSRISYAKLAKIASIQQDELDSLSETIQKSETLLINEIEKGQTLTNEHIALKEKYDELSSRHELLSVDYEKLTYGFLQGKMALEKLREANEELESVNLTLMAQQGSEAKNESTSPCLTCLERSKIESISERSKGKQHVAIDDANP